jgi:hypothetical protein
MVSCEIYPLTLPDPYRISNDVPFFLKVVEADESYLAWR